MNLNTAGILSHKLLDGKLQHSGLVHTLAIEG